MTSTSSTLMTFLALVTLVSAQVQLPDVIIGEPNDPKNDVLGKPLSEKEISEASSDLSEFQTGEEEVDPITTPGLFQGDIVLSTEDELYQIIEGGPNNQASAVNNPSLKWPNGVVPYVISSSFSRFERRVIGQAMAEVHRKTCIRFVARTSFHRSYVHILKGRGCSSAVGRTGGIQVVSLGNGCVQRGVVLHELLHALGFWHEHSRADRDLFVNINWRNIQPALRFNFEKKTGSVSSSLGLAYDYASVMHYKRNAFALDPFRPTIIPKSPGVEIGQRRGLSQLDTDGINLLYQCNAVGPDPTVPTKPQITELKPVVPLKPVKPAPPSPGSTCTDDFIQCKVWAYNGRCSTDFSMAQTCRKSCNSCGNRVCEDHKRECKSWARRGECSRNPGYMTRFCQASCGVC